MLRKRILAFVLCLCLMAGAAPVFAPTAKASTNGHTQAEAVQWAKARADENWEINDGSGWTQCTEFVWAYYEYLLGYHVNGHAYHYLGNSYGACPSGWTRPDKSTVQPGDIVIWDQYASFNARRSDYALQYGHIGIVVSVSGNSMVTAEANSYNSPRGAVMYKYNREVSCISGIIRPDWPNIPPTIHSAPALDIDGFYARIYNSRSGCYISNINGNVELAASDENDPRQIWQFIPKENHTYQIINMYDNGCLDAVNWGDYNGTNVGVAKDNGTTAQRWWVCGNSSMIGFSKPFYFIPSYLENQSLAMDVYDGGKVQPPGTNIQLYENWYRTSGEFANPQSFNLVQVSYSPHFAPALNIEGFSARIYHPRSGCYVANKNGNVELAASNKSDTRQIWQFIPKENNTYKIVNMYDKGCLDATNWATYFGANVGIGTDNGASAQRWWLCGNSSNVGHNNPFYFIPSYLDSQMLAMDVYMGGLKQPPGTNIQLYVNWYKTKGEFSDSQTFYIEKIDAPVPTPAPSTEIIFAQSKWYLTAGNTLELAALDTSAKPYPGQLEWRSDNAGVAAVDSSGKVTGIKDGSAVISASAGRYTASCTVIVGPWYQSAVDFALENGLMNGYSDGSFGANDRLGRAQLAQILYNKEDRPAVTVTDKFSDIGKDAWYSKAVSWAAERKIVNGYDDGRFGHSDPITRQDLAVMLWRYAGSPDSGGSVTGFSDADKISGYAENAMRWAVENGIMSGSGGKLNPLGYATRAEAAQMLKNYIQPKMQRG